MKNYFFLDHTADVKFQCKTKSLISNFKNCFLALKETICGNEKLGENIEKKIIVKGTSLENLLYNFLEEFLFLIDTQNFIFSKISEMKINREEFETQAIVLGDDLSKYDFSSEVKAITYNELFIKKEGKFWVSQVVLDV